MGQPAFLYPTYAASSVTVTASGTKAGTAPANVLEAVEDTCWQPASTSGTQALTFDFGIPQVFDTAVIIGKELVGVSVLAEASTNGTDWVSIASAYDDLVADTARNIHPDPLCATPSLWDLSSLADISTSLQLEMIQDPPPSGFTTAYCPATAPFISCLPGDNFVAYARVTIPSSFYALASGIYLGAKFYNSGGGFVTAVVVGTVASLGIRDTPQVIGGTVTVPAGAVSYQIFACLNSYNNAVGSVTFDDFFLSRAGDLPLVSVGGSVSLPMIFPATNRGAAPVGEYRYRRINFTGLGASTKINHVIFASLANGTLPYFAADTDADALEVEAKAITSTEGYYLGTTHSRTMRPFFYDFGLLSAAEAATLRAWADACVKTPRAFAFVPDVDLSLTYFVWQEKPGFSMPQVSSGMFKPTTIELISRINYAD